jgi:ElaB/YqjD/DUF883 family membrane-anchored ribosome-binding protein
MLPARAGTGVPCHKHELGDEMEASQQTQQDHDASQVEQVADQARETVSEATEQAKEKAQNLAGQAQERVRKEVDQRSTEAGERIGGTAEDIRSVSAELRNQGKEGPARVAEQAAERIERAGSYLEEADADRLLSDVEDFGRQRPWAVLAGAAVVGIAAARVLKASSRQRYSTGHGQSVPGGGTAPRELSSPSTPVTEAAGTTTETATPAGVR